MHESVAYILLIDGIPYVFSTTEEVPNSYAVSIGFDSVYPGLSHPQNLPCRLEVRDGVLSTTTATFTLTDITDGDTLAALFAVALDDAEQLASKVEPGDTGPIATYNKHVGTEKFGAAGERRRYSCVPGYNIGISHISANQAYGNNLGAAPVSDTPILWAGRRCAVYRLVQDDAGAWPDLTVESVRLACRIWWGTLLGQGTQDQRVWTLRAAGHESWSMGLLGQGVTQTPYPVYVDNVLDEAENQHILAARLDVVDLYGADGVTYTYVSNTINTDLAGATTYDQIADAVHDFLQAIAADAGLGSAYNSGFSDLVYRKIDGDDGIQIRWDRDAGFVNIQDKFMVRLTLLAHPKVWKILGYSPAEQNSSLDPIDQAAFYGQFFRPFDNQSEYALYQTWAADYPTHWAGNFYSGDSVAMKGYEDGLADMGGEHTNNGGGWRRWGPIYPGGTNTWDLTQYRQTFRINTGYEPIYLQGSKVVPLPEDPTDETQVYNLAGVGDVTHQGLMLFEGPYRDEADPNADVLTIHRIARVAWREFSDGSVATDADGYPTLVIYTWPDQQLYGIDGPEPELWSTFRETPQGQKALTARPLLGIEATAGPDHVASVYARILATTGTAGEWYTDDTLTTPAYGLNVPAYLAVGANDLGIAGVGPEQLGRFTDAETGSLGLGVPAEMIATTAGETGGIESALSAMNSDLYRCKIALTKPTSARDVVKSLLSPTGWCMSLAGGKYGLFDPFVFEAPPSASGVITVESLAGKPGDPSSAIPTQQLRKESPIDTIELQARINPATNAFVDARELRSPDPGALYRAQNIRHKIDGSHLIHPFALGLVGGDWRSDFLERWRTGCRWWARQHFEATFTVPARRAVEFFPGSRVSVSNEWLVNPAAATYGVAAAPGYVVELNINTKTETATVRCIVEAGSTRLYAPSALVTRYDEDEEALGYRLLCADDYLGIRANTGTFDVDGFAEPEWSISGGNAEVQVLSFDGVSWTGAVYGEVESVHAEPGNCYITLTGPIGATWYRDQHHIVVLVDANLQSAAWPLAVLGVIGDKDGEYFGTPTPKFKDT